MDIDNERVKQTSIKERLNQGSDHQQEQVHWDESKLREHCFASRRDEYTKHLNEELQKCKKNEETLQIQIKNVVYKAPSKGEKHWIIAQSESQLGWIPHLYIKAPSRHRLQEIDRTLPVYEKF